MKYLRLCWMFFGCIWISQDVQAQFLAVQVGQGLPSSAFGNVNINKVESGFAKHGFAIALEGGFPVTKQFSLYTRVSRLNFSFDEQAYESSSGDLIDVEGAYKVTSALAGAMLSLKKADFTFDLKLHAGFASIQTPTLVIVRGGTAPSSITVFGQQASAPAIGFGLTIGYALSDEWSILASTDQVNATFKIKPDGISNNMEATVDRPFQAYMLSLGARYHF